MTYKMLKPNYYSVMYFEVFAKRNYVCMYFFLIID